MRHSEPTDRWTWLVVLASKALQLARPAGCDLHWPWGDRFRPAPSPPTACGVLFRIFSTRWSRPPVHRIPCGRSPGRPQGRRSGPALRHATLTKTA